MNTSHFFLALLAGWCGTPYPRRFPFPWPPIPGPDPAPDWSPITGNILGAAGGFVFYAIGQYFIPSEINVTSTIVGGVLGARLFNEATVLLTGNRQPNAVKR